MEQKKDSPTGWIGFIYFLMAWLVPIIITIILVQIVTTKLLPNLDLNLLNTSVLIKVASITFLSQLVLGAILIGLSAKYSTRRIKQKYKITGKRDGIIWTAMGIFLGLYALTFIINIMSAQADIVQLIINVILRIIFWGLPLYLVGKMSLSSDNNSQVQNQRVENLRS